MALTQLMPRSHSGLSIGFEPGKVNSNLTGTVWFSCWKTHSPVYLSPFCFQFLASAKSWNSAQVPLFRRGCWLPRMVTSRRASAAVSPIQVKGWSPVRVAL